MIALQRAQQHVAVHTVQSFVRVVRVFDGGKIHKMKLPSSGDVMYLTVLFKYFAQLFVFNQFTGPMRAVDVRQDHVQGARRANHIVFSR